MQTLGDKRLDRLLAAASSGKRRALSRLVSAALRGLPEQTYPLAYPQHTVGITGASGVGKSALLSTLIAGAPRNTAILAVDPISPFSGGAFLADRLRMERLPEHVFFRSLPSDSVPGGLASGLGHVLKVLAAAGFDTAYIETVGSGQDETKVQALANTVLVLEAPGMGDDIQALKMGLLEIADIYVVNKMDLPGAEALAGYLRAMLEATAKPCRLCRITGPEQCGWVPPVLKVSATKNEGIAELAGHILRHAEVHRDKRQAFDDLRRAFELLDVIDTAYALARSEALLEMKPSGINPGTFGELLANIIRRLEKASQPARGERNRL